MRVEIKWSPEEAKRLMEAYNAGGSAAAYAAFPERTRGMVRMKIQRMRENGCEQRELAWPPAYVEKLMDAYAKGGYAAARAAFPKHRDQTLRKKIQRELSAKPAAQPEQSSQQELPRFDSQALAFRIAESIGRNKQLRKRAA